MDRTPIQIILHTAAPAGPPWEGGAGIPRMDEALALAVPARAAGARAAGGQAADEVAAPGPVAGDGPPREAQASPFDLVDLATTVAFTLLAARLLWA